MGSGLATKLPQAAWAAVQRSPRLALLAYYGVGMWLLHDVQHYRLDTPTSSPWLSVAAVLFLLTLEALFTAAFERTAPPSRLGLRFPWLRQPALLLGWLFRAAIWSAAFIRLVEMPAAQDATDRNVWMHGMAARVWAVVPGVLGLTPWLSLLAVLIWLGTVEWLVVRRRMLRGTVVTCLSAAMVSGLLDYHYHGSATAGAPTMRELVRQKGVESAFDVESVAGARRRPVWRYARTLSVEPKTQSAFVTFGQTLDPSGNTANLWKIDLRTGGYHTLVEEQVRAASRDPDSPYLYAFPWHHHEMLRIDKATFKVAERIKLDKEVPSPMYESVHSADSPPFVFTAFNGVPYITKVDTRSGKVVGRIDMRDGGVLADGDLCCLLSWSPLENALFFAAGRIRSDIVGWIDADTMKVRKWAKVPGHLFFNTVTTRPPSQAFILTEFAHTLYRIDGKTLAAEDIATSPPFSRIAYDPYLDRIVILSFVGGKAEIRTRDGTVERTFDVGDKPSAVDITEHGIYIASAAGLVCIRHDALGLPILRQTPATAAR